MPALAVERVDVVDDVNICRMTLRQLLRLRRGEQTVLANGGEGGEHILGAGETLVAVGNDGSHDKVGEGFGYAIVVDADVGGLLGHLWRVAAALPWQGVGQELIKRDAEREGVGRLVPRHLAAIGHEIGRDERLGSRDGVIVDRSRNVEVDKHEPLAPVPDDVLRLNVAVEDGRRPRLHLEI